MVCFEYNQKMRFVCPYKIVFKEGFWYLLGTQTDQLRSYRLSKIKTLTKTKQIFVPRDDIEKLSNQDDSIWIGQKQICATVAIKDNAIGYFRQRQILPKQNIIQQTSNGDWLVQTHIWHQDELLSIVRCWIPNISIVYPKIRQSRLNQELAKYLNAHTI